MNRIQRQDRTPIAVGLCWSILAVAAAAQTEVGEPGPPAAATTTDSRADAEPAELSPCPTTVAEVEAWIDRFRRRIHRTVCVTAFRFDRLFGDVHGGYERDETFGRAGALLVWDEFEGWSIDTRFKAKVTLPQMERRLNAFFGRSSDDPVERQSTGPVAAPPAAFGDTDAAWLAGFGYSPVRNQRNRLDFGVGMKVGFPMEPYVDSTFRRYAFFDDRSLMRFREIFFWRYVEGFGTATRFDFERLVGRGALLRWSNNFTLAQHLEGLKADFWLTLYHRLGERSALAWQVFWHGESDRFVPVKSYGLRINLRRRMTREWLVLEGRAVARWRREFPYDRRELVPELGFGFEIQFGG